MDRAGTTATELKKRFPVGDADIEAARDLLRDARQGFPSSSSGLMNPTTTSFPPEFNAPRILNSSPSSDINRGDVVMVLENTTLQLGQQVIAEVAWGSQFRVIAISNNWVGVLGIAGGREREGWVERRVLRKANVSPTNTVQAFEQYPQLHATGRPIEDAQYRAKELHNRVAKVTVDFPDKLKSRFMYYNISGPVWVFTIKFCESNGVAATMVSQRLRIVCTNGKIYGNVGYEKIFNSEPDNEGAVRVKIPGNGTRSYTSWVNSPDHELSGGRLYLDYIGEDANGHSIKTSVSFVLVE